jgi:CHAT domain-containing protein
MVEVRLVSSKKPYRKRWLDFTYGSDLSVHRYTEPISFARREQKHMKDFLNKMEELSERGKKLRAAGKTRKLRRIDTGARKALLANGRRLYRILKRDINMNVSSFEGLFGQESELTLVLDSHTRKLPWELANDGQGFLCMRYDVGRKIENPFPVRESGIGPEHRKALVVGLNYRWENSTQTCLNTAEREALSVRKQLEKKGYTVRLRRSKGKEATVEEVKRILSEGVSIFHFSGHGAYRTHQPTGRKGCLVLRDGDLNEKDLRECFSKAKGAPYLTFLNACQSAKEIYSSQFVDAFLDYGSEYVIGTFWPVYDQPSTRFATRFYKEVISGTGIAHALQLARWQFANKRGAQEASTWPSFVLYGSPSHGLPRAP